MGDLQQPSTFSDLYFKLYDDGHYWVEVLNWWASDLNIHDHDFSGVQFQLSGKSLDVTFKFQGDDIQEGVQPGRFDINQATVWTPGTASVVLPGDAAPHSVCHLNLPTVSLLFRTYPVAELGPQRNYFPPDVRGSYKVATTAMRTRLKIMRMLSRSDPDAFREAFRGTTQGQTVQANLFTVIKMTDILFTPQYSALLAELASSDVLLGDVVVNAGAHYRSTDFLKALMKERPGSGSLGDGSVSIAALASSWDEHSLNMILSQLSDAGWKTDVGGALSRAVGDGSLAGAGDADRILRRYGLTMADV
ncbi:hypothetical protein AD006_15295 [Pseudonocardia sp. EC080610-09]|uniref:hypothetical protein n=1 Tax=unclassified Pseudonocardia TaxID=2619320 RepID=UPI0006CB38C2|nr:MULTISPECIES: hypothetical protein [unclassified Pseudonocardia]ALE73013.1 hypothetical protein FRP1_07730 [Pseudonocardia sp. EC080625-04]ALL76331.1 hypothetical protein AD006_15295 [Pseudonocardia sp. EC080610-09]ALL83358.1 hypothetical protein AD017_23135 [Pseudonocardia sp. EC080619-01]